MAGWAWHLYEGSTPVADLGDATDRKVTWRLAGPGEASFTIPGDQPIAALIRELVSDVVVSWNGARLWRGRVGATTDDIDGTDHTVDVAAVDYRGRLERRQVWTDKTWTTLSPVAAAWDLIDQAQQITGGAEGITSAALPAGTVMALEAKWGDTLASVIDGFAASGQFDWWIDGDRVFHAETFRGGARDFALVYGETAVAVSRSFDPAPYSNVVRASGADGVAPSVSAVTGLAGRPEGRWESQVGNTDLTTATRVSALADVELSKRSTLAPDFRWTITPDVWTPDLLWLGDLPKSRVRSGRLNVDTNSRVQEITVSDSGDGHVDVDMVTGSEFRRDLAAFLHYTGQRLTALARR